MLCGIEVVGQLQTFGYIHNMNVEWIQIVSYSAEECWGKIHIMGKNQAITTTGPLNENDLVLHNGERIRS